MKCGALCPLQPPHVVASKARCTLAVHDNETSHVAGDVSWNERFASQDGPAWFCLQTPAFDVKRSYKTTDVLLRHDGVSLREARCLAAALAYAIDWSPSKRDKKP